MSKQNLIIFDFENLYNILYEIKDTLNYKLIDVRKDLSDLNINKLDDYLIITQKKIPNLPNQLTIDIYPQKIGKILELINVNFLKRKFNQQSDIPIGNFKINMNSRILSNQHKN